MEILHSGIDWLGMALQAHPVLWLGGTYLVGIVSGILVARRKNKKG